MSRIRHIAHLQERLVATEHEEATWRERAHSAADALAAAEKDRDLWRTRAECAEELLAAANVDKAALTTRAIDLTTELELTKQQRDHYLKDRNFQKACYLGVDEAFDTIKPELDAYRAAANYDALMEGPRFKGWNQSQLNRARALTEKILKS